MQDVDKEISEMKLSLNARARIVAESYLSTVSPAATIAAAATVVHYNTLTNQATLHRTVCLVCAVV
jgi:hypothetical protein